MLIRNSAVGFGTGMIDALIGISVRIPFEALVKRMTRKPAGENTGKPLPSSTCMQ